MKCLVLKTHDSSKGLVRKGEVVVYSDSMAKELIKRNVLAEFVEPVIEKKKGRGRPKKSE